MEIDFKDRIDIPEKGNVVIAYEREEDVLREVLSASEYNYLEDRSKKAALVVINQYERILFLVDVTHGKLQHEEKYVYKEKIRNAGYELLKTVESFSNENISVVVKCPQEQALLLAEGLVLGNYHFTKYKRQKDEEVLKKITFFSEKIADQTVREFRSIKEGVFLARDLINEPLSYLTATCLSDEIERSGKRAGYKVEVLNKKKIESMKMGGLLAVNRGSEDPPTFNILEWKPEGAINNRPYLLVGKGVVYDTGGLSLKPTANSMDMMKSDMGGAATVIGAIHALSAAKIPVHVVGLIPATDNRPGKNAYVPGDVIKMYNGLTVEVLNTDAEGRMILADALSYAEKYNPELVIDFATLTGSAARAIGSEGLVAMQHKAVAEMRSLIKSGESTYERIVEFPMWEEYDEQIKSDIADLKNLGGPTAGAITAAKFLQHFTAYPWVHFDIAGSAFLTKGKTYRPKGGVGVGVRLIFDYFKNKVNEKEKR